MTGDVEHTQPAEAWTVPGVSWDAPPPAAVDSWVMPARAPKPPPIPIALPVPLPLVDDLRQGSRATFTGSTKIGHLVGKIRSELAELAELSTASAGSDRLSAQSDELVLQALVEVEAASRQLGAVQIALASVIDDRSPYEAGADGLSSRYGHRRSADLIEALARISDSEAKQRVRVASAIRSHVSITGQILPAEYPAVATALNTGQISPESGDRIITGLNAARKNHHISDPASEEIWEDSFRAAETHLAEAAATMSPDMTQIQIRQWRDALDPDGVEPREEEIHSHRGLRFGRERNGITRVTIDATAEEAALLRGLMAESDAAARPRFFCEDDALQLTQNGIVLTTPEETARLLNGGDITLDDPRLSTTDGTPVSLAVDQFDGSDDAEGEGADGGDPAVGSADHSVGGPRFRGTATRTESVDPSAVGIVTAARDLRTREQRHSDTFFGYLRAGLRATADETGDTRSLVQVTAVVNAKDLETGVGVGWIDGIDEPVSLSTIERFACTDGVRTAILGEHGEILSLGHSARLFTKAIKLGVTVRDGGTCIFTDCFKPARQTEVHHVIPWSRGGKTDINNAVLLCAEHHRQIHTSAFTIKMVNGRPFLLAPRWLDPAQTKQALGKVRRTTPNTNRMRP
jgi:hypothetical protein